MKQSDKELIQNILNNIQDQLMVIETIINDDSDIEQPKDYPAGEEKWASQM